MYQLNLSKQEKDRLLEVLNLEKLMLNEGKHVLTRKMGKVYVEYFCNTNLELFKKIKNLREI